jgi:hypothetical protein
VLSGRYRLDALVAGERDGSRAVWRGTDIVLARTVAIEIRTPGGPAAADMLQAAYGAGRVIHPCLVSVYDAADEGTSAYVVSEWAAGQTLREQVREAPLQPARAAAVARGVAEGLAALHAAGVVHGNVYPGSVWVADEAGECTIRLSSVRPTASSSATGDVRAIGGVLYAALTGQWPAELPTGPFSSPGLPDAHRRYGRLVSPRQVRAGIPPYLDALTTELLAPEDPVVAAADIAVELSRLPAEPDEDDRTTLLHVPHDQGSRRGLRWRFAGVLALAVVLLLLAGWVVVESRPGGAGRAPQSASNSPAASPSPLTGLAASLVGAVGDESRNAELAVDRKPDTMWRIDSYTTSDFGNLKNAYGDGMGVVVDTGNQNAEISNVIVSFSHEGATAELLYSDQRGGTTKNDFTPSGASPTGAGATTTFRLDQQQKHRYWLIFITGLPPDAPDRTTRFGFSVDVREITLLTG